MEKQKKIEVSNRNKNLQVAIDDLQDICEKENVCPFCGGDIEEEDIQEDCGIYVRRKCAKCGEEF